MNAFINQHILNKNTHTAGLVASFFFLLIKNKAFVKACSVPGQEQDILEFQDVPPQLLCKYEFIKTPYLTRATVETLQQGRSCCSSSQLGDPFQVLLARNMLSFLLLCSFLLCNGLMEATQRKVQELPDEMEEEEGPALARTPQTLSRGWGDEIEWVQTYEEGLARSRQSKKPLMVIHHLEECPYSQALKKAFASSREIQQMAKENFIMLNLVHSSSDDNLAPDGHYVPRILFVDPSMTVRADITGKYGNRMYTYEPQDISTLIENMRQAKALLHTEL